jgi:hypothetical protein
VRGAGVDHTSGGAAQGASKSAQRSSRVSSENDAGPGTQHAPGPASVLAVYQTATSSAETAIGVKGGRLATRLKEVS